ncbi:IS3 family transposase [Nocardia pseudovaccinii]|uniref:IS3 family transposase n=1 Tax=Nocardia pseudovaccinii TaxID=189540 RepID=UPI003D9283D0
MVRERPAVKFAAIAGWADSGEFDIDFMCRELDVSRSGYYAWRGRGPSERDSSDAALTRLIRTIHQALHGNPGVRRVHAALRVAGHRISRKRVWRLMRAAGLQGRHPKSFRRTTIRGSKPVDAPDLFGRDFTAAAANRRWCGDITYVKTWAGWAYIATVIDLHDRAVVGWAIADHMRTSLITDALDMALARRRPSAGVIFHSDRGSQYTSKEFASYCRKNKIRRSLGRTGSCFDNAVAESFFATYKKELVHTRPWPTLARLRTETFDWIENYYNTRRRHSSLNYLTPQEYSLGYREISQIAA